MAEWIPSLKYAVQNKLLATAHYIVLSIPIVSISCMRVSLMSQHPTSCPNEVTFGMSTWLTVHCLQIPWIMTPECKKIIMQGEAMLMQNNEVNHSMQRAIFMMAQGVVCSTVSHLELCSFPATNMPLACLDFYSTAFASRTNP